MSKIKHLQQLISQYTDGFVSCADIYTLIFGHKRYKVSDGQKIILFLVLKVVNINLQPLNKALHFQRPTKYKHNEETANECSAHEAVERYRVTCTWIHIGTFISWKPLFTLSIIFKIWRSYVICKQSKYSKLSMSNAC